MRAFILRRVELISAGVGDVVLVGSTYSAGTLRIKEFLMRNGHPYSYIDLERDPDVQNLLDSFQISTSEIPVLICRGQLVLRNPTNHEIADCLGFNESIDQTQVRDLISSAPVPQGWLLQYMEHQKDLTFCCWKQVHQVVRQVQAQESKITWDFLQESQARSWHQEPTFKLKSSVQICLLPRPRDLSAIANRISVEVENGARIPARTVLIATGAEYRRLPLRKFVTL